MWQPKGELQAKQRKLQTAPQTNDQVQAKANLPLNSNRNREIMGILLSFHAKV